MAHRLIPLFISLDSVSWLETVAKTLSRQRNTVVSTSEAAEYIFRSHYIKSMKKAIDQRHADKVGDKLKGSKLVRPGGASAAITVTK